MPGGEERTQTSRRGQSQGTEARGGEGGLPQVLTPVLALLRVAGQDTFVSTCLLPEAQPQNACLAAPQPHGRSSQPAGPPPARAAQQLRPGPAHLNCLLFPRGPRALSKDAYPNPSPRVALCAWKSRCRASPEHRAPPPRPPCARSSWRNPELGRVAEWAEREKAGSRAWGGTGSERGGTRRRSGGGIAESGVWGGLPRAGRERRGWGICRTGW